MTFDSVLTFGQYIQQCQVTFFYYFMLKLYLEHRGEMFAGDLINENTLMKVFRGLNETTGVVLEYLQDAKVIMGISWQ